MKLPIRLPLGLLMSDGAGDGAASKAAEARRLPDPNAPWTAHQRKKRKKIRSGKFPLDGSSH
jgi:hypothetical protein